ncbi:MAG TPA: hypothetical protein VGW58_20185 [Pyrinomonadaceae bacterium]|nr:hypothetical protein [Pyrinomonadaceae bacterium]
MKKTILNRVHACARFIFFGVALLALSSSIALAQTSSQGTAPRPIPPRPDSSPDKDDPPLTTFEEEIKAKRAIKMAEKEHQENVKRATELSQIAKDLQTVLKNKSTIDRDSVKKIDRLEKLIKKIRGEAGGEDEEVQIVDRPVTITAAVDQIAERAESLSKSVQNTPRQVVSATVINNANVLLELIRVLRAFDPRP